jgi:hypothetical protein
MLFTRQDFIILDEVGYPIKFNSKVFHEFEAETNIKFFDYIQEMSGGDVFNSKTTTLIYYALREGAKIAKQEMRVTRPEVDSMDLEYIMYFIEKLNNALSKLGNGQKAVLKAEANKVKKVHKV